MAESCAMPSALLRAVSPTEQFPSEAQDVAAFQHARKLGHIAACEKASGRPREMLLRDGGFRCHGKNHCKFAEHESGIFDKHGIRQLRFRAKRNDAGAEVGEKFFVGMVLGLCLGHIDGWRVMKLSSH
jgi:hypothetical protein